MPIPTMAALRARIAPIIGEVTRQLGNVVVFTAPQVGRVYNEDTGTWTPGTDVTATGSAVQVPDNPEHRLAMGLQLEDPITLRVAAEGLSLTPSVKMSMTFGGRTYQVKSVEAVAPDGGPIIYTVIGDR
jgi:hypothetical protein